MHVKELVANQLAFCRVNQDAIVRKANPMLLRHCCNVKKLGFTKINHDGRLIGVLSFNEMI